MKRSVHTALIALVVALCSPALAREVVVDVADHPEIGVHLVGPEGFTLYGAYGNAPNGSTCLDTWARTWPPLITADQPSTSANLNAESLGVIGLPDGRLQVTYAGRPLHTFFADRGPGDLRGQGRQEAWHAVSPGSEPAVEAQLPLAPVTATMLRIDVTENAVVEGVLYRVELEGR